jgi:putative peptidoglycan lipid II flippase
VPSPQRSSGRNAALVGAGILASRLFGLVRQRLFAHFLGNGVEAAAFAAATRIPNVLQNLLGEGVLSASFIPTYAGLRARGLETEARQVAASVFSLLLLVVGLVVAAGLAAAPMLVDVVAPGYAGEARNLTVMLVRIVFPGTGVLVLSAWCLGVLNSHKRFFLSYAAPVVWNGAIIAVLLFFRASPSDELVRWVAWATVAGSVLQFVVQLPSTVALVRPLRLQVARNQNLEAVVRGFGPAVAARGVVQVSAYVDLAYASLLTERAVAALNYAQTIALLPVSLFGMAISAAELPDMAADAEGAQRLQALAERLRAGLQRVSFFVVPSALAFASLGDAISTLLLQSGRFTAKDSRLVWYILLGSAVALLAQTQGRLYASVLYAVKDTKTPLRRAALRVTLGIFLGYPAVRWLPAQLGLPSELGIAFVTVTTSLTAWLEMTLLRRSVHRVLGTVVSVGRFQMRLVLAGASAAVAAMALKALLVAAFGADTQALSEVGGTWLPPPAAHPAACAIGCLGVFALVYGLLTVALGVPQANAVLQRLRRRKSKTP